ncbi:MAG: hypothetical protein ACKO9H_01260, partial [Planctomycetota bacterium]
AALGAAQHPAGRVVGAAAGAWRDGALRRWNRLAQTTHELTPPGRGQVVSHALYQPEELAKVRAQVEQEKGAGVSGAEAESEDEPRAAGSVLKANAELGNLAERLERIEAAIKRIEERLAILEC